MLVIPNMTRNAIPPIFGFQTYQEFLVAALSKENGCATRAQLAKYLPCQSSFVSQVLTGRSHFSLEHAIAIAKFFALPPDESRYFLLMVQKAKAGSQLLEEFFEDQMREILRARELIRNRIQVSETITSEDESRYYSSWWLAAIHILSAMDDLNTEADFAKRLSLPHSVVAEALSFLVSRKLVIENQGRYSIGKERVHLDPRSPLISRHHSNWRLRAIEAIEKGGLENLHYSLTLGVSTKDAKRIRSKLLDLLQESEPIVRDSEVESPYVMLIDFFGL